MSYYAQSDGYITIRKSPLLGDAINKISCFADRLGADELAEFYGQIGPIYIEEVKEQPDSYTMFVAGDCKYDENILAEILAALKPLTVEGAIDFEGEDSAFWRYDFENGTWVEKYGRIVYEDSVSPNFMTKIEAFCNADDGIVADKLLGAFYEGKASGAAIHKNICSALNNVSTQREYDLLNGMVEKVFGYTIEELSLANVDNFE